MMHTLIYSCLTPRNDYGVRSLESILDMVKVMSFALMNGKVSHLILADKLSQANKPSQ